MYQIQQSKNQRSLKFAWAVEAAKIARLFVQSTRYFYFTEASLLIFSLMSLFMLSSMVTQEILPKMFVLSKLGAYYCGIIVIFRKDLYKVYPYKYMYKQPSNICLYLHVKFESTVYF